MTAADRAPGGPSAGGAAVILLDARGRFAGTATSDDDEAAIQARLEGLVRAASRSAGGPAAPGG